MLTRELDVQRMTKTGYIPSNTEFQTWVEKALTDYRSDAEVVIRVVDSDEISALNEQYRHKQGPTNILSFPFDVPDTVTGIYLLGDIVVCAAVLEKEAQAQKIVLKDHWAHIIVHGIFHLLGYDHINESDALAMEAKEILILQQLSIDNPYQENKVND